jgi:long-chain acyl-CoA synthetase
MAETREIDAVHPAVGAELTGAPFSALHRHAHLLEPVIARATQDPERAVAAYRAGDHFVDLTAAGFLARVRELGKGLIAAGVAPGERVVLMSASRLEWLLVDYAVLAAGAITVPIYDTSAPAQVRRIVEDSGAVLAVVETPAMRDVFHESRADEVLRVDPIVIDSGGLDALAATGRAVGDDALDERIAALSVDDIATIIYTSGTTGEPKGCVLTHGNLRVNVLQTLDAVRPLLGTDERSLLFLPPAHAFGKMIALVGVEHGVKNMFATDLSRLAEELPMAKPTMIAAVPRVFEKAFDAAQQRARDQRRGRVFEVAAATAERFARQRASGRAGAITWLAHALFDRLVYRKIRAAFGGALRLAFSGASPLGERLAYFYDGAGIRVFEGYGLSETSPVLTVNRADGWRPGTVGQPVAGTMLRIADDGEILAAGPQVFSGYWADAAATAAVLEDGWLRTGDVGRLEGEFLRIVGRKKDLIVTAGGKNVAPTPMEDALRSHPLISQAVVIGDNRPFVAALITIDPEAFDQWKARRGEPDRTIGSSVDHPVLRAAIQVAIDRVNASRSRAESIRSFAILPDDLTVSAGELTPTLKVRRGVVEDRYAEVIDRIYARRSRASQS